MTRPVYLDYNATAPLKPAVIDAVTSALAECGNASSVHRFGQQNKQEQNTPTH
jgi:cysteine desulfurase